MRPPRVAWRVLAEHVYQKTFPQLIFSHLTANVCADSVLEGSERCHIALLALSGSSRPTSVKSLVSCPVHRPLEETEICQTHPCVRCERHKSDTRMIILSSGLLCYRNRRGSHTLGIPWDQALFFVCKRTTLCFVSRPVLSHSLTAKYSQDSSRNQFVLFKHTPSAAGTIPPVRIGLKTTFAVPDTSCVLPAAILFKGRNLRYDAMKNLLLRNAADSPAFRFRGGGSHVSKAQRERHAEAATASARSGKFIYAGVLGVFVFTLVGTPLWFAFFYETQKAKYERLSHIEMFGDEDS